jgi:hypothetical protein
MAKHGQKGNDWYVIRHSVGPTVPTTPAGPQKTGPRYTKGAVSAAATKNNHTLYECVKFGDDGEFKGTYLIAEDGAGLAACTCPAANRHITCKHLKMLPLFKKNQAIDSGAMLQYDTMTWREATPPGEE